MIKFKFKSNDFLFILLIISDLNQQIDILEVFRGANKELGKNNFV